MVAGMTVPTAQALGVIACAVIASAIYLATLVHGVRSEKSGPR
jgi:hypothetical protein